LISVWRFGTVPIAWFFGLMSLPDPLSFESKQEFLGKSREFWNPDKTDFWQEAGIDLVIDRREGYLFWDMDGRRLIDLHLNGGTYNLGHRNAELIATLEQAVERFDIGNHHFPALARTALAEALIATCAPNMQRVIYGASGGEATDIAIKTARHTKQRRKIVSIIKGYHGHTGLAVGTGDDRFSKLFLADDPDEFVHVPFNDLDAMEDALRARDVAAVVLESIPATYGFPLPLPGYLAAVKGLCERYDALYIADEVQTGFMRTGEMWGIYKAGVQPDMIVLGKAITGGLYPISAVVVSEECSGWLKEDGFGHISTAGGAELGCGPLRARAPRDPGAVSRLARRDPPGRRRHGARVRPSTGREARHEAPVRARRVGDLLDP
jgi:acetylornithine/succinyldiaminopimelate/putrescine aminotransferase